MNKINSTCRSFRRVGWMLFWCALFTLFVIATFVPKRTGESLFSHTVSAQLTWLQAMIGGVIALLSMALVRRHAESKRRIIVFLGVGIPWLIFTIVDSLLRTPPALQIGFIAVTLNLLPLIWSYASVTMVICGIWDIIVYGDEPIFRGHKQSEN